MLRKMWTRERKREEPSKKGLWQAQKERWKTEPRTLALDLAVLGIGFVFGRGHLAFGAYPLGLAWIAVLPSHVPMAALGGFLGGLSMGKGGIILALVSAVVFMLRLVLSGSDGEGKLFREPLSLRVCAAVIGGFLVGVYRMLLSGLTLTSAAAALTMVLAPGLCCLLFSGLFVASVSLHGLLFGSKTLLRITGGEEGARTVFFQISFLSFAFFFVFSLKDYHILGISLAALPAAMLALLTAKRFGPMRGMAVGFVSALALSGTEAVALALAGLAGGLLFPFGMTYALGAGVIAVGLWSGYAAGLTGFLSVFPEFLISTLIASPLLRRIGTCAPPETLEKNERLAAEMIGSMALSRRVREEDEIDALQAASADLPLLIRGLGAQDGRPTREEYERLCADCSDTFCKTCEGYAICLSQGHRPFKQSAALLAEKLSRGDPISEDDLRQWLGFCRHKDRILDAIRYSAAQLTESKYHAEKTDAMAETCALLSRMLSESRAHHRRESEMNETLSASLEQVFANQGFPGGVIRAFGAEGGTILAACEDRDGTRITSPSLKEALERSLDARLTAPEYYRKEDMVLMSCRLDRRYEVESSVASLCSEGTDVSGDVTKCFVCQNRFYAVLCDGMGTGRQAKSTADFAVKYLEKIYATGCTHATALALLNHILRARAEECSATVDLFEFDLSRGEGQFLKSGAAPSFIKRGTSLFRIRSETPPVGLLCSVDCEKIKVEVKCDDVILLMSDGVCQSPEDAPWLMELLGKTPPRKLSDYANSIVSAAAAHHGRRDDMTVLALRILPS